jgi:hypothetical protein
VVSVLETDVEALELVSVSENAVEALGPVSVSENVMEALGLASGLETALETVGPVLVLEIVDVLAMEMRHCDDHVGKELDSSWGRPCYYI